MQRLIEASARLPAPDMSCLPCTSQGSLHALLCNEAIPVDDSLLISLTADIVQGMRFLHASAPPVIHGDLKSANVLVDSSFRAKVTDFGYAKQMDQPGKIVGSPYFMAPELLNGQHGHSRSSDVYAFGIMLYEIFAKQEPYKGQKSVIDCLHRVINDNMRPELPGALTCLDRSDPLFGIVSIMTQCWDHKMSKRPTFEEIDKCSVLSDKRLHREAKILVTTQRRASIGVGVEARCESGARVGDRLHNKVEGKNFPERVLAAMARGDTIKSESRESVSIFCSDAVRRDKDIEALNAAALVLDVFIADTGKGGHVIAVTNLHKDQDDHARRIAAFAKCFMEQVRSLHLKGSVHSGPMSASIVFRNKMRYVLSGPALAGAREAQEAGRKGMVMCTSDFVEQFTCQARPISLVAPSAVSHPSPPLWCILLATASSSRSKCLVRDSMCCPFRKAMT